MDLFEKADTSRVCPLLLDDVSYECDSVNLKDQVAKDYWLHCILEMLINFKNQARNSQPEDLTAEQRSNDFYESTKQLILQLSLEDYPQFSVRRLLDLIQKCLKRHGFEDPWHEKKRVENERALVDFRARLDEVDHIADVDAKWTELIKGVLAGERSTMAERKHWRALRNWSFTASLISSANNAGNMFDWGAKAVADILEGDLSFGLKNAMSRIVDRSWIVNGLPEFLNRIKVWPIVAHFHFPRQR